MLRFYSLLLKYCFPWSETIVNMLHVGKNKHLECLFKKSHWLILVKLNSSQEPETGNESTWLKVSCFMIKLTEQRKTGGGNEGNGGESEGSWVLRWWNQEAEHQQTSWRPEQNLETLRSRVHQAKHKVFTFLLVFMFFIFQDCLLFYLHVKSSSRSNKDNRLVDADVNESPPFRHTDRKRANRTFTKRPKPPQVLHVSAAVFCLFLVFLSLCLGFTFCGGLQPLC